MLTADSEPDALHLPSNQTNLGNCTYITYYIKYELYNKY